MNRSQIGEIFSYLTDVLGPRLTGSPNCRRANEWTRDKLASWGLVKAHLDPWGPFWAWLVGQAVLRAGDRAAVHPLDCLAQSVVAWCGLAYCRGRGLR